MLRAEQILIKAESGALGHRVRLKAAIVQHSLKPFDLNLTLSGTIDHEYSRDFYRPDVRPAPVVLAPALN